MTYWAGFDPTPYTKDEWTRHVYSIPVAQLRWCKFVTLHNTGVPNLAQWAEIGPAHDARLRNLQSYYAGKGWHQGPHAFISRSHINGFSHLIEPGIHASCFNARSIGLEQAGDFEREDYTSGDGAMVRDMAVHAVAVLCNRIGIRPDGYVYGQRGLHFHIECRRDGHACPGKTARNKPDLIARILARMHELAGSLPSLPMPPQWEDAQWVQETLNSLGAKPVLSVDGDLGPLSIAAIRAFQKSHGLPADGIVGEITGAAMLTAVAALAKKKPSA